MRGLSAAGPRLTNSDGLAPRLPHVLSSGPVPHLRRIDGSVVTNHNHRFITDLSPICHRFTIDFLDLSLPSRKTKLQSSGLVAAGV
jgi:hypothetical protein